LPPRTTSSPLCKLSRKPVRTAIAVAAATVGAAGVVAAALAGTALTGTAQASQAVAGAHGVPAPTAAYVAGPRASALGLPGSAAARTTPASHAAAPASRAGAIRLTAARHPAGAAAVARPARASRAQASAAPRRPAHPAGSLRPHSPCVTSQLHQWICAAETLLRQHGTPASAVSTSAAYIVVLHESGGNPHASNGWDANAAAGTPSEGIAQTIAPTFRTYALPGHGDIWNPVDNMVAAFRYAISRYGSMNNIPGVVSVRQGGSYVGY
jgi:Transglycosylase SLT domain